MGLPAQFYQEVCPWNVRFAEVAAERDYAAREAWEAEWDRDAEDPEGDGPIEAVELVAALSDEDPVVAEAAAWGLGRAKRSKEA